MLILFKARKKLDLNKELQLIYQAETKLAKMKANEKSIYKPVIANYEKLIAIHRKHIYLCLFGKYKDSYLLDNYPEIKIQYFTKEVK